MKMAFAGFCTRAKVILKLSMYIVYYFIKERFGHRRFNVKSIKDRDGDVAIVTGGGRGIGLHVTKSLLKCGVKVIIASRSAKSCEDTLNQYTKDNKCKGRFECMSLDLSSMKSVLEFAQQFKEKYNSLNLLICNSGIMMTPFKLTVDGFESQLGVNYLGHFLLSHLLLPELKRGSTPEQHSRIVNVTSLAHKAGIIKFDDLQSTHWYSGTVSYAQSKLAQVAFTTYANKLLKDAGYNVDVYCTHPGIVSTELYEHVPCGTWSFIIDKMFKSPSQGADTVLYSALEESLEGDGGKYIENSKVEAPNPLAVQREVQQRLYQISCSLTNVPSELNLS